MEWKSLWLIYKISCLERTKFDKKTTVECILPACQLCMLWWSPDDNTGGGPQVNKFEQGSSDCHQMSLPRVGAGPGGEGPLL